MTLARTLAALLIVAAAGAAVAQEAVAPSAEFARVSGGELAVATKSPSSLSGSLGVDFSNFGGKGYNATLGGELVQDRLWFFASAQHNERRHFVTALPEMPEGGGFDISHAKLDAALGSRQTLNAAVGYGQYEGASALTGSPLSIPSSFLSLRYTAIVSNNMLFTATVSRTSEDLRH